MNQIVFGNLESQMSYDETFFLDDREIMTQRSILEFGTARTIATSTRETARDRRNRLARERRARNRVVVTAQARAAVVEAKRLARNQRARERYAVKRLQTKSKSAIDKQMTTMRQVHEIHDVDGPFRLQTKFGNVSILNAKERLMYAARKARSLAQERRFLAGVSDSVTYLTTSYRQLDAILDRYRPLLIDGQRFILLFNGRGYTLGLEKYEELKNLLLRRDAGSTTVGPASISDEELLDDVGQGGAFTIRRPKARQGANFTFATGEFFPYIHKHTDDYVVHTLARLGCWTTVDAKNYKENCLWLAFKDAGVDLKTLEAIKTEFLDRKIARKNIRKVAEDHNLFVKITTDGKTDGYGLTYGPNDGYPVNIALIREHYIHNFETDITSYAFKNFNDLKDKEKWWRFYKVGKRAKDGERGMSALALIRLLLPSEYLIPISAVTDGVFRTQYHNKVSMDEFETLEYNPKYSVLKHAARDGSGPYTGENAVTMEIDDEDETEDAKLKKNIMRARAALDDDTLKWLDAKFVKRKIGLSEQLKMLRKHKRPDFAYDFDFETCPFDKHREFMVCYKEDTPGSTVQEQRGFTCAKDFLNDLAMKHGVSAGYDTQLEKLRAPVVKLRAHNIDYDFAFIAPHIRRINTIVRGTSIVCGTARYYCNTGEATNGCNGELREWMRTEGEKLFVTENPTQPLDAWKRATAQVNMARVFIQDHEAYKKMYNIGLSVLAIKDREAHKKMLGIGPVVLEILSRAPWAFNRTEPFYLMRVIDLSFQDSYKMIPEPLSKFGKMFRLDQQKEVMPYTLYTEDFVESGGIATWGDIVSKSKHFEDFAKLRQNLRSWGCERIDENGTAWYDMMEYAATYCRADVDVLSKGWNKFRDMVMSEMEMDINCYPTVASMTDAYYIEQGIYENVHEMAGVPLKFHANASVGGRVMCANNERSYTTDEMDDTDANSLYPSAQIRLGGFLIGAPKVWHPGIDLEQVDGYCVKILVTYVGRNLRFPVCRLKTAEGGCNWTNALVGKTITVDKWTLEDLVRHQGVQFQVLQGYYFDEGRNHRLGEVVSDMFDRRQRYKAQGNPLQLVLKIALNSGYGICGLKPIETDTKYVSTEEKTNFIQNHFNHIKYFEEMPNGEFRFDLHKQIDTHYNRQHCAMEVLSMSKTIMNEPMVLAEDIGIGIEYQDTDSMHVPRKDSKRLEDSFEKKYGKALIGSGEGSYGQFSTDFEFSDAWHYRDGKFRKVEKTVKTVGDVKAIRSIFLGKKSYIDELSDDAGNIAWHMRMKGIPSKCMLAKVASCFDKNPMKLYEWLLMGKKCEFDLTADGNCCFKTTKTHQVYTHAMTRSVRFPIEVDLCDYSP